MISGSWTRFDPNPIVYRTSDSLLAAEVSLGSLYGHVAKQKLDLFKLSSR